MALMAGQGVGQAFRRPAPLDLRNRVRTGRPPARSPGSPTKTRSATSCLSSGPWSWRSPWSSLSPPWWRGSRTGSCA